MVFGNIFFVCLKKKKTVAWVLFRLFNCTPTTLQGFPHGSEIKESTCSAGEKDSIPGSGRSPGEGKGYPLQCSCQENPWTEKPGRQRVGHSCVTETQAVLLCNAQGLGNTVTGPQAGHSLVPFFSQSPRATPVAPKFQLGKKPGKVSTFMAAAPHTAWKNPRCQRAVDVRRCRFL